MSEFYPPPPPPPPHNPDPAGACGRRLRKWPAFQKSEIEQQQRVAYRLEALPQAGPIRVQILQETRHVDVVRARRWGGAGGKRPPNGRQRPDDGVESAHSAVPGPA